MCAPRNNDVLFHINQEPLTKCPIKINVESGNNEKATATNDRKRSFKDTIKTALLCGSCLAAVLLLRGNDVFFAYRYRGGPLSLSAAAIGRMTELARDLGHLDQLKKDFVDNELELGWDRQHMAELRENVESMRGSFRRLTRSFDEEANDLFTKNESLREALVSTSVLSDEAAKFEREALSELSRQADTFRIQLTNEAEENARLKKLLSETIEEVQRENIPVPQPALRGSSLKFE